MAPLWVADCGISPENSCSKDTYEKFRKRATHPVFGRLIYYYDLWSKMSAIQDRLQAVIYFYGIFILWCLVCLDMKRSSTQMLQ